MRAALPLVALLLAGCATPAPLIPSPSTPFGLFSLDEERGLFGVRLGASASTIPDARPLRAAAGGASFVESASLPLRLGAAPLTSLSFALHDGVVVAIVLEVEAAHGAALLHELEARFGGPSARDPNGLLWAGSRVQLRWEEGPSGALLLLYDEGVLREHGAKLPVPTL